MFRSPAGMNQWLPTSGAKQYVQPNLAYPEDQPSKAEMLHVCLKLHKKKRTKDGDVAEEF